MSGRQNIGDPFVSKSARAAKMIDYGAWKAFLDATEDVMQRSPLGALCEEVLPIYREWRKRFNDPLTNDDIGLAIRVWAVLRLGLDNAWVVARIARRTLGALEFETERYWCIGEPFCNEQISAPAVFEAFGNIELSWEALQGTWWSCGNLFYRRFSENDDDYLSRLEQFYKEEKRKLNRRRRFQDGGLGNETRDARFLALRLTGLTAPEIARHEKRNLDRKHVEKSIQRFVERLGIRVPKNPEITDTPMQIDDDVAGHYASLGIRVSVHALRMYSAARRLGFWDIEKRRWPITGSVGTNPQLQRALISQ